MSVAPFWIIKANICSVCIGIAVEDIQIFIDSIHEHPVNISCTRDAHTLVDSDRGIHELHHFQGPDVCLTVVHKVIEVLHGLQVSGNTIIPGSRGLTSDCQTTIPASDGNSSVYGCSLRISPQLFDPLPGMSIAGYAIRGTCLYVVGG